MKLYVYNAKWISFNCYDRDGTRYMQKPKLQYFILATRPDANEGECQTV